MFDRELGGNEENDFIESLRLKYVRQFNATQARDIPLLKLTQFLDVNKFYNYKGSLTTPPCDEDVEWLVIDDPQHISDRQLEEFKLAWEKNPDFANGKGNNRFTVPLNGRKIYTKGVLEDL